MRNFFIELNIYYKICIFIKFFNNKNKSINKIKIININLSKLKNIKNIYKIFWETRLFWFFKKYILKFID